MRPIAAVALIAFLSACASNGEESAPFDAPAPRTAWIVNAAGAPIGEARLRETRDGVLIKLDFSEAALPPGWHGAHLHERGDCADPADGFRASGAHLGHGGLALHGLANPIGPEAGDLPNLFAPAGGPFGAEFFTARVTLGPAAMPGRAVLLDADGAALIIHAAPDDHESQPIGGAGARLACAALSAAP